MMSSNGFGGGTTGAGPRVQVRPTSGTESSTVFATEEQLGLDGQRELFTDRVDHVDVGRPLGQRVELRIVRRLGVGAENGRINLEVDLVEDLGEAPPALTPHHRVHVPSPQVGAIAGGLQLTPHRHRPGQAELQTLQNGVVGLEHSIRPHGTPLEFPNVHSQHSRLT
jgi:hypothetical protein